MTAELPPFISQSEHRDVFTGLTPSVILETFLPKDNFDKAMQYIQERPEAAQLFEAWSMCSETLQAYLPEKGYSILYQGIDISPNSSLSTEQVANMIGCTASEDEYQKFITLLAGSEHDEVDHKIKQFLSDHIYDQIYSIMVVKSEAETSTNPEEIPATSELTGSPSDLYGTITPELMQTAGLFEGLKTKIISLNEELVSVFVILSQLIGTNDATNIINIESDRLHGLPSVDGTYFTYLLTMRLSNLVTAILKMKLEAFTEAYQGSQQWDKSAYLVPDE